MEIEHLLTLEDGQLKIRDEDAMLAKVEFWLDTPRSEYWGKPFWGHRLHQFRHEPISVTSEVAMENMVIMDLEQDIPEVIVTGIALKILEKDQFMITVNTNYGAVADKMLTI
jgi:hypothetical protein